MSYGQAQQAYPQAATPAPQNTGVENLNIRLGNIMEEAAKLRSRLTAFADRVGGSEPPSKEALANAPKPVPNGSVNMALQTVDDLYHLISQCHDAAARIDRIG